MKGGEVEFIEKGFKKLIDIRVIFKKIIEDDRWGMIERMKMIVVLKKEKKGWWDEEIGEIENGRIGEIGMVGWGWNCWRSIEEWKSDEMIGFKGKEIGGMERGKWWRRIKELGGWRKKKIEEEWNIFEEIDEDWEIVLIGKIIEKRDEKCVVGGRGSKKKDIVGVVIKIFGCLVRIGRVFKEWIVGIVEEEGRIKGILGIDVDIEWSDRFEKKRCREKMDEVGSFDEVGIEKGKDDIEEKEELGVDIGWKGEMWIGEDGKMDREKKKGKWKGN